MAQLSSNTLIYNQIFLRIKEYVVSDLQNQFASQEQQIAAYNILIQEIYENISQPITKLEPFIKGEPPISAKLNTYSSSYANDLNIIAQQLDYINAKTVNVFNLFLTEMQNEKRYLERISSKSKILQMYSKSPANDIYYFGDTFESMDKINFEGIRSGFLPLIENGQATLALTSSTIVKPTRVLFNSADGFLGNNHQLIMAPSSDGASEYKYMFEDVPIIGALAAVVDSNPLTYVEVEALNVDKSPGINGEIPNAFEFKYIQVEENNTGSNTTKQIDWSNYETTKPFQASFAIEYPKSKANCIEIVPYFGGSKLVKVNRIEITKSDGTVENILINPIFIGSSLFPMNLDFSKNHFYNKAVIRFPELEMVKAEVFFEQTFPEEIDIGHIYWKPNYSAGESSPFSKFNRFNPDILNKDIYSKISYDPSELIPSITNPNEYKKNGIITKNVKVKVTTKVPKQISYFITFDAQKVNVPVVSRPTRCYFWRWDHELPMKYDSLKYYKIKREKYTSFKYIKKTSYPNLIRSGTKYFTSEAEAQSDLDALKKLVSEAPDNIIKLNNEFVKITNIQLEKTKLEMEEKETVYDIPLISQREIRKAKRMSIGIRDITIKHDIYANQAEIISRPFYFEKNVEALMLSVEGENLIGLENESLLNYYVSLDGSTWIEISPIQLDSRKIPEVLAFNQNVVDSAKLPGVAYVNSPTVPQSINNVWVRIEISKPQSSNISPIIYSYELIAKVIN